MPLLPINQDRPPATASLHGERLVRTPSPRPGYCDSCAFLDMRDYCPRCYFRAPGDYVYTYYVYVRQPEDQPI